MRVSVTRRGAVAVALGRQVQLPSAASKLMRCPIFVTSCADENERGSRRIECRNFATSGMRDESIGIRRIIRGGFGYDNIGSVECGKDISADQS